MALDYFKGTFGQSLLFCILFHIICVLFRIWCIIYICKWWFQHVSGNKCTIYRINSRKFKCILYRQWFIKLLLYFTGFSRVYFLAVLCQLDKLAKPTFVLKFIECAALGTILYSSITCALAFKRHHDRHSWWHYQTIEQPDVQFVKVFHKLCKYTSIHPSLMCICYLQYIRSESYILLVFVQGIQNMVASFDLQHFYTTRQFGVTFHRKYENHLSLSQ